MEARIAARRSLRWAALSSFCFRQRFFPNIQYGGRIRDSLSAMEFRAFGRIATTGSEKGEGGGEVVFVRSW